MMLASPLIPAAPEDPLSFRPARDVDAFNSLLPPPIEFVEGSSSGALAIPEGKYQPINVSPKLSTKDRPLFSRHTPSPVATPNPNPIPASSSSAPSSPLGAKHAVAQPTALGVELSWPETCDRASGLYNTGNTCFLNSALQCLLHTPPLLRVVIAHGKEKCRAAEKFCMVCVFRQVTVQAHKSSAPFAPSLVTSRLQTIAKHMRRGRQEDSHEFLRYAIDAMQKSCLSGCSPKLEAKLAETTWVHKIFGGKLRSRVSCKNCGHNSDTFDRILDLSIDILKADSLKEALRGFVAPDYLKGADKYKCEKCKKHVNAEKRFTIHDAPTVLTVHLKRFSPLGRKIGHHVTYDETLNLQPYMSKDQFGPTYSLYGVICHAGGGPNSGHYYAYVKSRRGKWYEMNDETVAPISGAPVNKKMAYILFYLRNKGQGLQAALRASANASAGGDGDGEGRGERVGLIAGMKKRRERGDDDDEEDLGERVGSSPTKFIGPLLPSPMEKSEGAPDAKRVKTEGSASAGEGKVDPQAEKVKKRIQAAQAEKALAVLKTYDSSDSSDDEQDTNKGKEKSKEKQKERETDDENEQEKSSPAKPPSSPLQSTKSHLPSSPVSTTNFYGATATKKTTRTNDTLPPSSPAGSSSSDSEDDDYKQKMSTPSPRLFKEKRKKDRKLEKAKLRMSMSPKTRGYVNPFSRIGSENALRSGGFGTNRTNVTTGAGGPSGRMHTYGKRNWRPKGL